MMFRKQFSAVLITFLLVAFFATAAAAKTTLMALTVWNEENYQTRGLMLMAKRVSELTKGDLSLRVEYGGSLGYKGAELLNAVNDGQLDIAKWSHPMSLVTRLCWHCVHCR